MINTDGITTIANPEPRYTLTPQGARNVVGDWVAGEVEAALSRWYEAAAPHHGDGAGFLDVVEAGDALAAALHALAHRVGLGV